MLVSFAEVADRTAAEQLRGLMVEADVDPTEQPDEEDAYYDRQLVGLEARTSRGELIGVVESVVHHGEQDTVIVRTEGREVLIPFVSAIVPTVDLAGGFLVVADLPGLIDPELMDSAEAD
jgi:16S rRNA processing protein RimM